MFKFLKNNKIIVPLVVLILITVFFVFQKTEFGFNNQAKVSDIEEIKAKVSNLGSSFLKNYGQIDSEKVEFYTSTPTASVFVLKDGLTYSIEEKRNKKNIKETERLANSLERPELEKRNHSERKGFAFNEKFVDFNPKAEIIAENPSEATLTYFKDSAEAQTGSYSYEYLSYKDLWHNIDLELHLKAFSLEKVFKVQPGGNPRDIKLQLEGPEGLTVTSNGDLSIITPTSNISMTAPVAYQIDASGQRQEVTVSYKIIDNQTYTFEVGDYDPSLELVIDPLLAGTAIPSGEGLIITEIKVDSSDNIYVAGYLDDYLFFPTTVGAYHETRVSGSDSAFISKFSSDMSTLLASTFLGGNRVYIYSLIIDDLGRVIVSGSTEDVTFPTTAGAYDTTHDSYSDSFISVLNSDLTELSYSTFLGGSNGDFIRKAVVDNNGDIIVSGHTQSNNFPTTTGAYDTTFSASLGVRSGFVSKFSSDLSTLEASTLFGGNSSEWVYSMALNNEDEIYIYGRASSSGLASTTTYQTATGQLFIAKLSNDLTTYMAGTYFTPQYSDSQAYDIIVENSGNVVISGVTKLTTFPTTAGAYDTTYNGGADLFLSVFNPDLTELVASTYLGGAQSALGEYRTSSEDYYPYTIEENETIFNNLAIDSDGNIVIICNFIYLTYDFANPIVEYPTTPGAFQESLLHPSNFQYYETSGAAISKLSPNLSTLVASTFISGASEYTEGVVGVLYEGRSMTLDNDDNVIVGGTIMNAVLYHDAYHLITDNAYSKIFVGYESDANSGYLTKIDSDLSSGIHHLAVRGKNIFDAQNFDGGLSSLPAGFTTGGGANWFVENDIVETELGSARSGPILDNEETYLDTSYTFERPGNIEFRWKTEIEGSPYDMGFFCIDKQSECGLRGDVFFSGLERDTGWKISELAVSTGDHNFRWKYVKDSSYGEGEDAIWIDDIKFTEYVNSTTTPIGATTTLWFEAQDLSNNLEGSYYYEKTLTLSGPSTADGTPTCTDKDGVNVPFGNPITLAFIKGRASCNAVFYTSETVVINVTDGTYNSTANSSYGLTLTVGEGGGESTPPSGGGGSSNTSVVTITNDPNTPDAIAASDPVWEADYEENVELLNKTFEENCQEYDGQPGWYGRYFDYPASHPDMEISSIFWGYTYGDPLSKVTSWTADWYDDKYFKFAKLDSNLKFGSSYFPFDYAPEEYTQGHGYHFGSAYASRVTTDRPGDYTLRISSDDDSWVYVDGKLIIDNHGVHGANTRTATVRLSGTHLIQVFFAERHTVQSHLYFTIDDPNSALSYQAFLAGCSAEIPSNEDSQNDQIAQTATVINTPLEFSIDNMIASIDNITSNVKEDTESDDTSIPEQTENTTIPEIPEETETPSSESQSQEPNDENSSFLSHLLAWFTENPVITNVITFVSLFVITPVALALQFPIIPETLSHIKTLSDFQMILSRSWVNLLGFLGLRKKKRYWGTVYDSQNKQPLDPALVQLIDVETKKPVEQCFTDLWGRFGFVASPGRYYLTAGKTHYQFPSTKETGSDDGIFDNLYHGEIIEITDSSETITPNIPMDPLGYDWNQEAKLEYVKFHPVRDLLIHWTTVILFWLGLIITTLACFTNPTTLNKTLLAIYLLIIIIRFFLPKGRLWGRVFSKTNSTALPGLNLELNHETLSQVVLGRTRTSPDGKFFLKAEPGHYTLTVKDPNTKATLAQSEIKVGKDEVVNEEVGV